MRIVGRTTERPREGAPGVAELVVSGAVVAAVLPVSVAGNVAAAVSLAEGIGAVSGDVTGAVVVAAVVDAGTGAAVTGAGAGGGTCVSPAAGGDWTAVSVLFVAAGAGTAAVVGDAEGLELGVGFTAAGFRVGGGAVVRDAIFTGGLVALAVALEVEVDVALGVACIRPVCTMAVRGFVEAVLRADRVACVDDVLLRGVLLRVDAVPRWEDDDATGSRVAGAAVA